MARILAITLAGLGTADGPFRLASGIPAFDSDGLYRDVVRLPWPAAIDTRADWQKGKISVGGFTINLLPTVEVQSWLRRPDPSRVATLDAAIDDNDTTLTLSSTALAGLAITIGREAIIVGTHAGSGVYTGCTRGALSTRATEHGQGEYLDTDVFLAVASPVRTRTCELIYVDSDAASYAAGEVVRTHGIVKASPKWTAGIQSDGPRLTLTIDTPLEALRRSRLCVGLWQGTAVRHADGEDATAWRSPSGQVPAKSSSGRVIVSDGEGVSALSYTAATGAWVAGSSPFAGSPKMPAKETVHQVFSTKTGAPAVNAAGDVLLEHPCDLVLQLLTTTPDGGNGAYDLGVKPLGIGMDTSLVDVAGIEAMKAALGDIRVDNLHFPKDPGPLDPMALISERILRPFGLLLMPRDEGKLGIARLVEEGDPSSPHLYDQALAGGKLVNILSSDGEGTRGVERLSVLYGDRPGAGPSELETEDVFNAEREIAGYNVSETIDMGGLSFEEARRASEVLASLFHAPIPDLVVEALDTFDVSPGDEIRVTAAGVPGRAGTHGISAETFTVEGRSDSSRAGTIRYDLLWTGAKYLRRARIAPGARVVSNLTNTVTVENDAFLPGGSDAGVFEDILSEGGGSSIECNLLDSDLSFRDTITITGASGSGNTLTWTGSTAPVLGDVIVLTDYGSETDSATNTYVKARYVFMSDNASPPTVDGDDPYEWSS